MVSKTQSRTGFLGYGVFDEMMTSTLSGRGQNHASVGEADLEFSLILDNPYDAKNNPSGIISLGTADNV